MKIKSLILIGLGGTGSALAEPLCRLLSYHFNSQDCKIYFIDRDKFEAHNSERQSFALKSLNENKARTKAKEVAQQVGISITPLARYVNRVILRDLIQKDSPNTDEITLIVGAVDNDATRKEILETIDLLPQLNLVMMTPGNGLDIGQCVSWGRIHNKSLGTDPREDYPKLHHPEDYVPSEDPNSCLEQAVSTPQLGSANQMAALSVLLNVQNLLDQDRFYQLINFDVYRTLMVPDEDTLIQLQPQLELATA